MPRLCLVFCSLMLLGTAVIGCGDDDAIAGSGGTSGSGGSSGSAGNPMSEGAICESTSECVDGLTCVPTGVTSADPMFCARGCERQVDCDSDESCSLFCRPSDPGCTSNPAYCATLVNAAWSPCGFGITSTCGTTSGGGELTCLVTERDGSLGFCAELCEFNTSGQCPNGQTCSADFLRSSTIGVCATPVARGQACDLLAGDVCATNDICASLTDPSGTGTCRQFCGQGQPACAGSTECTVFAQFVLPGGVESISACFPTANGNQDGGM